MTDAHIENLITIMEKWPEMGRALVAHGRTTAWVVNCDLESDAERLINAVGLLWGENGAYSKNIIAIGSTAELNIWWWDYDPEVVFILPSE